MSDVTDELQERIQALEDKVEQLRRDLLDNQVEDWKARIDALEMQAHLGQMEAREELNPLVERLRNRWLDAREQADKARSAAGDALGSLAEGAKKALGDLQQAMDEAAAKLRS